MNHGDPITPRRAGSTPAAILWWRFSLDVEARACERSSSTYSINDFYSSTIHDNKRWFPWHRRSDPPYGPHRTSERLVLVHSNVLHVDVRATCGEYRSIPGVSFRSSQEVSQPRTDQKK